MPNDEEDDKDEETSEDLDDSSPSEEEEDSDDSTDKSDDQDDKNDDSDEDEDEDEPKVPLFVLKKERAKRRKAEERLRETMEKKSPQLAAPGSKEQNDAKEFLRGLIGEVFDERDAAKKAVEDKEDEMYEEMLEEFVELDPKFKPKKFSRLVEKYKPADKDAAWEIWKEFGEKSSKDILNPKSEPKHILPKAKKTTDKSKTKSYKPGTVLMKNVHQIVEEAIREDYGDEEG